MALEENMGTTMLVSPTGSNGLGGGFGGDGFWILLLFLLLGGNGFGGGNAFTETQAATMNGFNGINAGLQNLSTQIGGGFADAQQNSFGLQNAMSNGFLSLQNSLNTCCCENRLASVQTQNVVQSEGAATRLAIENQTQAILDKMCQQEIDNLKSQNIALQNQVNMLNLSASQTAQTAALIADNTAQTNYLISKLQTTTTA